MSSLVVNTNISAIQAYDNLNATNSALSTAISRLSSGLQIQTAADNPAGYVVSQQLLAESNGYGVDIQNAQNGISMIQTADGALGQITSILQTMNQLALQAANGTTSPSADAADQAEFVQLQNEIDQIANSTNFAGQQLLNLSGASATITFQVGTGNNGVSRVGVTFSSATTTALGVASTSVSISGLASAQAAISAIASALASVNAIEGSLGAYQNEFQAIIANLTVGQQNMTASYSRIVDVNMAQEMTQFTTDQILMQSGVAMLSQAQQEPSLVLKLLT